MATQHYTVENYRLDESIGFLVQQVRNVLHDELNTELAHLGISWAQWKVLMRVHFNTAQTAAELCRCLDSDTGSMTRMLDRLEEKGFLRRLRCEADRRVVRLGLTEAGQALVPGMLEAVVKALNHLLVDFSPEEVAVFKSLMLRIIANGSKPAP